jgi:hypothetical protein
MTGLLLVAGIALHPPTAQAQTGASISGVVTDAASRAPLALATVSLEGTALLTSTDANGSYRLTGIPGGPQVLRVIRIGYAPLRRSVVIPAAGALTIDVAMARSALNLPGIIVVADPLSRAKGELGTASVIEGEAIRNQTAASLQGLLELIPGVVLQAPGLDGVQQFGLRSIPISAGGGTGPAGFQPSAGDLASFGTQIVLDGVPISNNANLQSLGVRGELAFSTSAGGGIDLRRLPASTIERVEVIRGIPSSRFGDLTQGAVLVDTRAGAIAPEVLVRLDARTAEASVVGGTTFGKSQTGSATFDIARTRTAPGQTDDESSRYSLQVAHRLEGRLQLDTRIDAFKVVEDRPESPVFPGVERRNRDGGIRASERARLTLGARSRIELTSAYEAIQQRSFSRQPHLRGATPFTNRLIEGTQVGKFVGGIYDARVNVEGDPRHFYNRLELVAEPRWLAHEETFRAGLELRREWNGGPGYLFDIEFPPQVEFNGVNGYDRPRRFDLIPPMVTTGLYLDERVSRTLGAQSTLSFQAGLRLDLLHEGRSWFSGVRDQVLQPRLNVELAPTGWFRLRAGAGRLAKVPALGSLFPGLQYYDLINVNYFANDPAERLAVLTTRIVDKINPALGFSVADRLEAGFEAELAPGAQIAFAAFHDRVKGAVGVAVEATSFLREHFDIDPATIGTGRPPEYLTPASSADTVPVLIDRPANNLTFTSSGAELIAVVPEIPGSRTRMAFLGSYVSTRVENAGIELNRNFYDFQLGGTIPRVPYWDGTTRTGNRLLLTTRMIHHQPQAGLVVTGTVQFTLKETRQDIGSTDTLGFAGYLTREGKFVPVSVAQRADPQFADLRQSRSGLFTDPQKGPVDWLFSLQVAKTLPAGGRLSFYAFNAFDRVGNYGDRFTTSRLFSSMRFGLELTMPVPGWR